MLAETPLVSACFLSLLELSPQVAPALVIPGPQLLHREDLLCAGDCSHHSNRAANRTARSSRSLSSSNRATGSPIARKIRARTTAWPPT